MRGCASLAAIVYASGTCAAVASQLTSVKDASRSLPEDRFMTEAAISVDEAVEVNRDTRLLVSGECSVRDLQPCPAVGDGPNGLPPIGPPMKSNGIERLFEPGAWETALGVLGSGRARVDNGPTVCSTRYVRERREALQGNRRTPGTQVAAGWSPSLCFSSLFRGLGEFFFSRRLGRNRNSTPASRFDSCRHSRSPFRAAIVSTIAGSASERTYRAGEGLQQSGETSGKRR